MVLRVSSIASNLRFPRLAQGAESSRAGKVAGDKHPYSLSLDEADVKDGVGDRARVGERVHAPLSMDRGKNLSVASSES